MYKVNKVIAYICYIVSAILVITAFFKGKYLFFEGIFCYILGLMFSDTYEKEKEIDKN